MQNTFFSVPYFITINLTLFIHSTFFTRLFITIYDIRFNDQNYVNSINSMILSTFISKMIFTEIKFALNKTLIRAYVESRFWIRSVCLKSFPSRMFYEYNMRYHAYGWSKVH